MNTPNKERFVPAMQIKAPASYLMGAMACMLPTPQAACFHGWSFSEMAASRLCDCG